MGSQGDLKLRRAMYVNTIRGGLESDPQVGTGNLALGREFWK